MDVTIKGAEDLATLSSLLRRVGDRELRRELFSSLQRATKPTKAKVRASALSNLPHRGGLAALIAAAKLSTRTRSGGRNPRVRIEARSSIDVRSLDKGRLRHPLFGDTDHWFQQAVPPGWFSKPIEEDAPAVRRELLNGMRTVAEKFLDKH